MIPIKVWVVLGPGESIGNTSNKGCRLSTSQIQSRIGSLQNHANIFGQNVTFQWSPATPTTAQDPRLLPFQSRTRDASEWHQEVVANYWQADHINIYFVGNVQTNPDIVDGDLAGNLDPSEAQGKEPQSPTVVLNDGGFDTPSGFVPGGSPSGMTSYFVFEHEMTHYLARFKNRTFGQAPNQRVYDSGEHVPANSNNILRGGGAPPPLPLIVPGRWNQAGTEQQEIWDRINTGNWNNP